MLTGSRRRGAAVAVAILTCAIGALISASVAFEPVTGATALRRVASELCGPSPEGCRLAEQSRWAALPLVPGMNPFPTAFLGLVYFSVLGTWLAIAGPPNRLGRAWHLVPTLLAAVGGIVSLWLVALLAHDRLLCLRCLAVHECNAVAILGVFALWPRGGTMPAQPMMRGAIWAGIARDVFHVDARPIPRVALAGTVCSCIVIVAEWAVFDAESAKWSLKQAQRALETYTENPSVAAALYRQEQALEIPVQDDDPGIGPRTAPHTLVIFSDYRCPACREFDRMLESEIMPVVGQRMRIVRKQYPLLRGRDAAGVDAGWTPSWKLARAAVAARQLGGEDAFWRMHRLLTKQQTELSWDRVASMASELGLDPAALSREMRSPATEARIRRDIAVARWLGARGVPSLYLDGREVENWDLLGFWTRVLAAAGSQSNEGIEQETPRPHVQGARSIESRTWREMGHAGDSALAREHTSVP